VIRAPRINWAGEEGALAFPKEALLFPALQCRGPGTCGSPFPVELSLRTLALKQGEECLAGGKVVALRKLISVSLLPEGRSWPLSHWKWVISEETIFL
jgi:hypothetical protein